MGRLWEGCCQWGVGRVPCCLLAWLQDCGVPSNPDYGPRLALSPIPESHPRVPSPSPVPSGAAGGSPDVCLRKMPSPRTPCRPEVRGLDLLLLLVRGLSWVGWENGQETGK